MFGTNNLCSVVKLSPDDTIDSLHDSLSASLMGEEGSFYTVDEALVSMGFGKFQALILVYSGMGYAAEAMELMLLSLIGSPIQLEWNLSSSEKSVITSVVFAGMLLGASSWGIISDRYGRRKGFFFTALVTSGAGLLSAFSPNYLSLIISRFIVGVGLGGGPVLLTWCLEFIPTPKRGTWMIVFSCFWTLGTILEASLAWAVMPTLGWRWLLALSAVPSFFLLVFYAFAPESPRYFSTKGRTNDAMHILEKMARVNQMPLPSGRLRTDFKVELDENINPSKNTDSAVAQQSDSAIDVDSESPLLGGIKAFYTLLSPLLIKITLLLWMDFFGNLFAYYGVVLLTTELIVEKKCDSRRSHGSSIVGANPYRDVFITSFAEFPGFLLAAVLVDRIGRKLTMLAMLFIAGVFLVPLMFHQNEGVTTALLFAARSCITGSFNTLYIYAPEVYPTSVRSTGLGIASSIGRIGGILCPLVAVGLVDGCRQMEAVIVFEAVIFLSGVAVVFFPFETKGRELTDSIRNL